MSSLFLRHYPALIYFLFVRERLQLLLFDHFFNNALIEPFIKPLKTRLLFICRREGKEGEGDRAAYRRAAGGEGGDKAADAGPGAAPMEFRGGYGRGKPAQ